MFKILSLSLIFAILITPCLDVDLLGLSCLGLFVLPQPGHLSLPHIREVGKFSVTASSDRFSLPLSVFSSGATIMQMLLHLMV